MVFNVFGDSLYDAYNTTDKSLTYAEWLHRNGIVCMGLKYHITSDDPVILKLKYGL